MPKADNDDSTPRHRLLGIGTVAPSAVVLKFPARTVSPRSALIAVCDAFIALERRKIRLFDDIEDDRQREPLLKRIDTAQNPLVNQISAALAVTVQDHRARAAALAAMSSGWRFEKADGGCWDDMMVAALVRDLVSVRGDDGA